MIQDRSRWNRKYLEGTYPTGPADIVVRYSGLAAKGRALDIAAGNGRNALWLAGQGFTVDAVDISEVGLGQMGSEHPRVRRICVDLDVYDIKPAAYDLILNIRYLNRRLFPDIRDALRPGGVLIFESFLVGATRPDGGKFRREHLLRPNELLRAFVSLVVVYYEERDVAVVESPDRMASLVAIRNG